MFKMTAKEHVCIWLENISILNKFSSFELFTHQTILEKTLIVNMISEGSCVTEDWSNDAENINDILQNIHKEHSCFELL